MFRGRVEGLDRLSEILGQTLDETALNETLLASGETIIEAARSNLEDGAPPDTRSGVLAASLFAEAGPDGNVRIGTPLAYGWHLEMGTRTHTAYPWLTAALDNQHTALVQQVSNWLSMSTKHIGRL